MVRDRQGGREKYETLLVRGFHHTGSLTLKDFIDVMSMENFKDNEDSFRDTYSCLGKSTKVPE